MPVSYVRDSFDPEVDKAVLELAWRHLQIVHEFGPVKKPFTSHCACTFLDFTPNTQMKNVSYEVGFIRSATRVSAAKGVWWKGWLKKEDETNEPAYALRYAGCALSLFYLNIENPEDIFYNEEIGAVLYPSSSYVQENLKASVKSAKPPRTRMLPQGASKAVSKNVNPGPTGTKGPSKNSVLIDPLALWLPPDRLGFNSQNWEMLYE
ncbi:hypothetical protein GGU10DRAFT_337174, partial [Lentinula aff. detonsa]